MKRGPYKSYLGPDGNGVMPKSTFNARLRKYRAKAANDNNVVPENNADNLNEANPLLYGEIAIDNTFLENNAMDGISASISNQHNSCEILTEPMSWIDEEYDEETVDREIWFDAENSQPVSDHHTDYSNDPYQFRVRDNYNYKDHDYDKALCNCTTITRGEALMMVLTLAAEESLTLKTITAILSLINTLFQNDVVPEAKYKLFQTLKLNEDIIEYHLYCEDCFHYFGPRTNRNTQELVCKVCKKNKKSSDIPYFLTFNVASQLKTILEDSEVQEMLMEFIYSSTNNKSKNVLQNMSDGQLYKTLSMPNKPLSDKFNFTYTFNTDGCQPSRSSKLSIWPIYACINELPSKLQSKHMIMAGLWVDKREPDMTIFLQPFVDQGNKLSKDGVEWKLGDQVINSKFIPLCAVTDSVARCKILNMKQYNGTYGCTFCEHPTERVDNNKKFPISNIVPTLRTDDSIKAYMVQVGENQYANDIMGVWGPSPLMLLNHFNLADGMSPDYMHAILLGVIKQHTEILLSSFGEEYYIGNPNQLEAITTKLMDFKHPSCITRSPRQLTERDMWKATEWRSWLLFYSLISFKGILPQKYLEHLALLVEAVRILLSCKIKYDDLKIAETLIISYVALYQEYFGKKAMTYNIHLLLHMTQSVLNLGPLKYHNTFIFENENHFLLKLQKSPNHVSIQIARRYLFQKSLLSFKNTIKLSEEFFKFCDKTLTGRLKNTFKVDGCVLIGKGKKYFLNIKEREILNIKEECKSFNRFIYNGTRYTSKVYRFCKKTNDSIVLLKNGKVGIINNICYFNSNKNGKKIYVFYEEVVVLDKYYYSSQNVTVHNIKECLITEKLNFCEVEMILESCMITAKEKKHFVIFIPEGCYGD